jgi:Putative zinc-finger
MIDCLNVEIRELLPEYVHGALDRSARARMARHVAQCASCQEELELMRGVRAAFATAPAVDITSISGAIPRPARRRAWRVSTWRVAASLIVALGLGSISYSLLESGVGSSRMDTASAVTSDTPAPGGFSFGGRLSDLDEDSLDVLLEEIRNLDPATPVEPRVIVPYVASGGSQ